jgi:hypothetical protein
MMSTTFGLTPIKDLTVGSVVGCLVATLFAIAPRLPVADVA